MRARSGAPSLEAVRPATKSGPGRLRTARVSTRVLALSLAAALARRLAGLRFRLGRGLLLLGGRRGLLLLLGGRRGLARRSAGAGLGRFRGRGRFARTGHPVRGALEGALGLAGGFLDGASHVLGRASCPPAELVQPVTDRLLLLRVHRGVEQPLRLGLEVFPPTPEVLPGLAQELPELLVPALVGHGHLLGEGPITYCARDRKSTRLNSSHLVISYAVFC